MKNNPSFEEEMMLENGVHYPRVYPSAHPLTKMPEDSGYEINKKSITQKSRSTM